jgi:mRNA-degrading endonuclease toxin of MazEF toxin-antitoxin module
MKQGDIYHVDLDPVAGHEQAGARYVLIVSATKFNALGTPWVCPITLGGNFVRSAGFAVSLDGQKMRSRGVVLCNQIRALDLKSRRAKFIEAAPKSIVDDVLAKVHTVLE